jgi:hypothetical protein
VQRILFALPAVTLASARQDDPAYRVWIDCARRCVMRINLHDGSVIELNGLALVLAAIVLVAIVLSVTELIEKYLTGKQDDID